MAKASSGSGASKPAGKAKPTPTAKKSTAPKAPAASKTAKADKAPSSDVSAKVYQLKIVLSGSNPVIWRRVLVTGKTALDDLHHVFQAVMGWSNSHMHLFRQGKQVYADSRQVDEEALDERKTTLAQLVPAEKGRFDYVYDFGDDWYHEVVVEQIGPGSPGLELPTCLAGENSCPPEDCGGIPGYLNMLEVLEDPDHEEYEDTQEWIGETFEPFKFDAKKANARLKKAGF